MKSHEAYIWLGLNVDHSGGNQEPYGNVISAVDVIYYWYLLRHIY